MADARRRGTATVVVLIAAVLAAISGVPAHATHDATYEVRVGVPLSAPVPAESMRFLPNHLDVHPGDTIRFTSGGVHNVTLLPPAYDVDQFVDENAQGTTGEWSPFIDDADEGAQGLKVNPNILFPSFLDCGSFGQDPCSYTADVGQGPVSGGSSLPAAASFLDFSITVDAPVGTTFSAVDLLFPSLRMTVTVVDDSQAVDTAADVQTATDAIVQSDRAKAVSLHNKYSKQKPKTGTGAKTIWSVRPGVDEDNIALRSFYPSKLTIQRKQRVRWTFSTLTLSTATVTFPRSRGVSIASGFPDITCDTDGTGTAADEDPPFASSPYCDDPSQLEIDVPAGLAFGTGDGVVTNNRDHEHSGIRGASYATSAGDYTLRFTKKSSRKGFAYVSIAGHLMGGKVVVK